jgi:general secretion pathway protein L
MIGLLHGATQERSWYWTAVRALLVCAALLSLVALAGKLWQQQRALDDLDVQIAASRTKAQKVRTQIDELERKHAALARIRSEKAAPGLLEMWEQTTITLPSHSWLSELQLSRSGGERPEQQLNLSGYSDSAAGLVRIFDNSSLFEDATLTSPITVDPVETKERFGLRMKISDVSGKEAGTK